jgi:hypothetical protein
MMEDKYYYNGEPLKLSYSNNYTMADKIEIISNIQNDFKNGMLSWTQMFWIIDNAKFGSYTCQRIVDKLIFDGKLKRNPITLDTRTFYKKPSAFDL